jgi:hypothetical protein
LLALVDEFAGRASPSSAIHRRRVHLRRISRVSREAPVLILDYDSTDIVPGGAGNAANNIAALGGAPDVHGVLGATTRAAVCSARCAAASVCDPSFVRLATSRRRRPGFWQGRPLRQAAGRADRSGDACLTQ